MKELLGVVLLLVLCNASVFAQKTAPKTVKKATKQSVVPETPKIEGHCIDLIGEDSVKFFLYLDDVLQNETAQAHVEVCNLKNDSYEAKIVLGSNPEASCITKLNLKRSLLGNDIWGHFGLYIGYNRSSGKYCIIRTKRFYESLESKIRNENNFKKP